MLVQSFVRYDGANCVYRRTPAFGCGVAAAASLLTGQVVLAAAAGCWGHCRARFDHRRAGVALSLLSWFLATLAACAFLVGALKNQSGQRRPKEGVTAFYRCTVLVAGVFAGGSLFSVAAAVVGIASYVAHEARAGFGPPQPPLSTTSETDGPRQGSHHACDSCGSTKAHAGTVC